MVVEQENRAVQIQELRSGQLGGRHMNLEGWEEVRSAQFQAAEIEHFRAGPIYAAGHACIEANYQKQRRQTPGLRCRTLLDHVFFL